MPRLFKVQLLALHLMSSLLPIFILNTDGTPTKYANDTYLMIGSSNIHTTAEEFGNIRAWAMRNNLQINANKTKEMIIFRRRSKSVTYPPEPLIPGAERVTALRVLGLYFRLVLQSGITSTN